MPLRAIVYVSTASRRLGDDDIAHLLACARRRNAALGVTGLLLYAEGSFMQYLEGPASTVRAVYQRITADPQHTLINELADEPIEAREFADWSMAYTPVDLPAFLKMRDGTPWAEGCLEPLGPGRAMLRQVWGVREG